MSQEEVVMKLYSTNNCAFKGIYCPIEAKFSQKQDAIRKDIKNKMGDRALKNDYSITPVGENAVSLYVLHGNK